MRSPSAVEPRTSAKSTATSTSAPPGSIPSQQRVQRFGFFGEGRNPAIAKILPPNPPNGFEQTLQRGDDGTARKTRRVTFRGRWPSVRSLSHSVDMAPASVTHGARAGQACRRRRAPPADHPDQPLLREGALGAAPRRPRLPRGAPRAGAPRDRG